MTLNAIIQWFTARPLVLVGLIILIAIAAFGGVDACRSLRYDKERAKYEAESKAWTEERAKLVASAEAKEKRIAELEPKAIAFDALAEQNKRIDAGLAKQIEEVSKNAAEEEARAETPTDCRIRAARVCDLLRANNIRHDCGVITRESCGSR